MTFKYKSYKRIHTYAHESDVEFGKIKKEKTNVKKYRKKQKNILKKMQANPEIIENETLEAYEDALHSEKKESGNAKNHKERLKTLSKNDEID